MTTALVIQQPWEWRWIQAALPLTSLYFNTRVEINRTTRIANIFLSQAHTRRCNGTHAVHPHPQPNTHTHHTHTEQHRHLIKAIVGECCNRSVPLGERSIRDTIKRRGKEMRVGVLLQCASNSGVTYVFDVCLILTRGIQPKGQYLYLLTESL